MSVPVLERVASVEPPRAGASKERTLINGEVLFRPGDERSSFYCIEEGSIAIYRCRPGRSLEVVEFAFAGDIVGLGVLPRQVFWAKAQSATRVRVLPIGELEAVIATSERAQQRFAEAVKREFLARRESLVEAFANRPINNRVAAFLLALSQLNAREGRDPQLIADSVDGEAAAAALGLDASSLGRALLELQEMGVIEASPAAGLRLKNCAALDAAAAEQVPPNSSWPD
jgi:CRP/FNR family transcriptional regulator